MNTNKIFNLMMAFVFALSLLGIPAQALAQEPAPNPNITAAPSNDWISGDEWPIGAQVTITIDDPSTPQSPDFTTTQTAIGGRFQYWSSYNFSPGFTVTLSDGITTKSLVVSPVQVTSIDTVNDRITGVTSPNREMWVIVNKVVIQIQSDSDGNWMADFTGKTDLQLNKGGGIKVFDDDGDVTHGEVPNPYIEAPIDGQWLHARDWLLDTIVTLTIDRPSTPQSPDYTDTKTIGPAGWNPEITAAEFDLKEIYPFQVGDVITISGGTITKTFTVVNIAVTNINPVADTISGTTAPGMEIEMEIWTRDAPYRKVTADGDGQWTADFSVPWNEQGTYDLLPRLSGMSMLKDEDGDFTFVEWRVPNPNLEVWVTQDRISANEWSLNHVLTLTIDRPGTPLTPDYTTTQTAEPADWNPNVIAAVFDLNGIFHYQVGDLITVSDGVITRTHTVLYVTVTEIDPEAETISGISDPGAEIQVIIYGQSDNPYRDITVDGTGQWTIDFSVPWNGQNTYDLTSDMNGAALRYDDDGDASRADWPIPDLIPTFSVSPDDDNVGGNYWPLDSTITIEIDNPITLANPDYITATTVNPADQDHDNQTWFNLDLANVFDLQPGQLVTVFDANTTKQTTVANRTIANIDPATDIIAGKEESNIVYVVLWACDDNGCGARYKDVNLDGSWSVNFALPGAWDWENVVIDIQPGTNGGIYQSDEDGDGTIYLEWRVLNNPPQLTALSPAQVWIGLKNSDDVGTKFDLLAEVYQNNTLIGSGQLDKVTGGSSGFNNAKLNTIPLTLFAPVDWLSDSTLSIKLYVRNTCYGNTHNSGTARLWYNDAPANSQFGATIDGVSQNYSLQNGFVLDVMPGSGPKKTIDVAAGKPCSPFKLFGTWTVIMP